ncbi:replication endonuclease [Vibrio hibernica]|uniref:replication endonuclease n=1 Tax=Vibrio hibernica TaxID=2587465 RepID=UPI002B4B1CF5|nr:replication endonuclease [Vibrio hibernica]
MYQLVRDEQTGFEEWIDFIPVQSWATADRIFDDQTIRTNFTDHIKGDYPSRIDIHGYSDNYIPVRDQSFLIKPSFSNPCAAALSASHGHRDFSKHIQRSFLNINKKKDYFTALSTAQAASERLFAHGYTKAMSDDQIKDMALEKSDLLRSKIFHIKHDEQSCFEYTVQFLARMGLSFREDEIKTKTESGELFALVNRACDSIWLRRQLRRKCAYEVEQVARDLQLVERHKQVYCSDFSVERMRHRIKSNEIALKETIAYDENDTSNFFTLHELSAKSVSNPSIRRAEMFTRLKGFEDYAKDNCDEAVFFTVTTPSRYHAISNSQVNKKWLDAGSPDAKQAHDHLLTVWAALRKIMDKKNIKVYGMRIAEPHQDGTPHHHLLLFIQPHDRKFVTAEFQRLAMADTPNEKGASKHRFKAELIDFAKGSAVGYIAKYLSKNIDGLHIDKDRGSSLQGIEAAERVVTWARVNQIRQFQFIGGPPVSVWRELRRLRQEFKQDDAMLTDLTEEEHFLLERVRKSADLGDWKAFCIAMGGLHVKRKDSPLTVQYSVQDAVEKLIESGEFSATKYGDAAQAKVSGLMFKGVFLCTRFTNWKIENKDQFLKAQNKMMEGAVDWFDALERQEEYQRMAQERYDQFLDFIDYKDELQASLFDSELFETVFTPTCSAQPDRWE